MERPVRNLDASSQFRPDFDLAADGRPTPRKIQELAEAFDFLRKFKNSLTNPCLPQFRLVMQPETKDSQSLKTFPERCDKD